MSVENQKRAYRNSLTSWFLFDYCLPLTFIVALWPIALYLLKIPYAFEQVFSSADLVPIGALLMLGAAREIDIEKKLNRITNDLELYRLFGIFGSTVMLFFYGVIKYYSMTYRFPDSIGQPLDTAISAISYLSLVVIVLSGCFCFSCKWGVISSLNDERGI